MYRDIYYVGVGCRCLAWEMEKQRETEGKTKRERERRYMTLNRNGASLEVQSVKNLPEMQETRGSIPASGRSPGEGNGNPLQYCCLENPMDRGAWQAPVHGVEMSISSICLQ